MNPKTIPSSLLTKAAKLTLLVLLILQFGRCAKSENENTKATTGTSFCCDPYGQYIGMGISTYSSAEPVIGYQSSSDSFDYEYTISSIGVDSIHILAHNPIDQTSYTYDLPLMSATEDKIIFGWDRGMPPAHLNSYTFTFKDSNDTLSLVSARVRYQSGTNAPGFSSNSTVFKGIKQ
jgi:hypothetical protein